jgi:hypothetical protein
MGFYYEYVNLSWLLYSSRRYSWMAEMLIFHHMASHTNTHISNYPIVILLPIVCLVYTLPRGRAFSSRSYLTLFNASWIL